MDNVEEMLLAAVAHQNGVTQQPAGESAEMVNTQEPVATTEQATEQPVGNPEMGATEQQSQAEQPTTESQPTQEKPVDYDALISEVTGGVFKKADELKSNLEKFTAYETLKQERDALEQKTKISPYANDFSKKIDELIRANASAEQLDNFIKINRTGDIQQLSAVDAKIAKMVLVDGWKESVAKLAVEQEFPLDDYEEGTPERLILEEKLRTSAANDKKALEAYKAEVGNTPANPIEEQKLQEAARIQQHQETVKATVPKIASQITGMGEMSFKAKEGSEIKMQFDYPQDFKDTMTERLSAYFMDGTTPINEQTVAGAYKAINAAYLDENFPQLAQKIFEQGFNNAKEIISNKYENRSGLPQGTQTNNPTEDVTTQYGDFLQGLVKN